ncbi:MAG TPA: methionine/alanine import family NSS transporter small subunit [Dermatophilaceae bacterium]|nr:methionine/alanine import family NSS transporter small subunit [Dermatophilaceae bacterium]
MTTGAIVMLLVATVTVWGGLVLALLHLKRADREDAIEQERHRDL